jgi:hypothetical protein
MSIKQADHSLPRTGMDYYQAVAFALNVTNGKINTLLAELETFGALNAS